MQRTRAFQNRTADEEQGTLLVVATANSSAPFNFFALQVPHECRSTA